MPTVFIYVSLPSFWLAVDVTRPEDYYRLPRRPPSQEIESRAYHLLRKKAKVLVENVVKLMCTKKNGKFALKKEPFCRICEINCDSAETFYDHINSLSQPIVRRTRNVNRNVVPSARHLNLMNIWLAT